MDVRRFTALGACLLALLAICGVATASASASAPELGRCVKKAKAEGSGYSNGGCTTAVSSEAKFEWIPGPGANPKFASEAREVDTTEAKHCLQWHEEVKKGNTKRAEELLAKFKLTEAQCLKVVKAHACFDLLRRGEPKEAAEEGFTEAECEKPAKEWEEEYLQEPVVLETTTGDRVECAGVTASGEYSGAKTVAHVLAKFTGCVSALLVLPVKCTSPGAAEGEIVTSTLEGELGIIKADSEAVRDQVGIDLAPAPGAPVTQFECGPILESFIKITVTGSVIHPVTTNKMLLEENEKFSQRKGIQGVENFEGGAQDVLKTSIGGGEPVRSGEGLLSTLVNEEKIEVNTVV
jgi:hypothetical protein